MLPPTRRSRIEQLLEIEDQAGDGRGRAGEDLFGPGGAGFARGKDAAGVDIVARGARRRRHAAAAGDVLDADARGDRQRRLADARREAMMAGKQPPPDTTPPPMPVDMVKKTMSVPRPRRSGAHPTPRLAHRWRGSRTCPGGRLARRRAGSRTGSGGWRGSGYTSARPHLSGNGRRHRLVAPGPIGDERRQPVTIPRPTCRAGSRHPARRRLVRR